MIRHICRFLKRLPKYIKLAWQQENSRYDYLYDLIEMKMKEFLHAQKADKVHHPKEVRKCIKQIEVCLLRFNRFRNWENFTEGFTAKENIAFEQKNFNKFWRNFVKWHRNWWT